MSEVGFKPKSAAEWVKAKDHENVLLPSGVRVTLRIPDLATMMETGIIPSDFMDIATKLAKKIDRDEAPTQDDMSEEAKFERVLISKTVVEPEIDPSIVSDLPVEDRVMLAAIAMRQRDVDAEGEHIAGLTKSEKFRRFRGLGEFNSDLAGV